MLEGYLYEVVSREESGAALPLNRGTFADIRA